MAGRDWIAYWEHMYELGREAELGPRGQAYILEKYGEVFYQDDVSEDYDDYSDYEWDVEY